MWLNKLMSLGQLNVSCMVHNGHFSYLCTTAKHRTAVFYQSQDLFNDTIVLIRNIFSESFECRIMS